MLFLLIFFITASCSFAMEEGQRPEQQVLTAEQNAIQKQLRSGQLEKTQAFSRSASTDELIAFGKQYDSNNNNNAPKQHRNQQVVPHSHNQVPKVWRVKNGKQEKEEPKALAQPAHNQISKQTVTDAKAFMKGLDALPLKVQKRILQYAFGEFVQQDIKVPAWRLPFDLLNPSEPLITQAKKQMLNPTFTNLPDSLREEIALELYLNQEPNAVEYMKGIQACVDKGSKCSASELSQALYKINDRQFIKDKFGLLYKIQGNETFLKAKEMLAIKNGITDPMIHGVRHVPDNLGILFANSYKINTKNVNGLYGATNLLALGAGVVLGARAGTNMVDGRGRSTPIEGGILGGFLAFWPSAGILAFKQEVVEDQNITRDLNHYISQAKALERKRAAKNK